MNQSKPDKTVPVLIGGVFLGVTSALPILERFNCACCMLVIGGGLLTSFLYLRDYPQHFPPLTYGQGATLGLWTGIVGGIVWTGVGISLAYIKMRLGVEVEEVERFLSDPGIPPPIRDFLETLITPGGLSLGLILISVFMYFLVCLIFASLGGILGVALFQKKPPQVETPVRTSSETPTPPRA